MAFLRVSRTNLQIFAPIASRWTSGVRAARAVNRDQPSIRTLGRRTHRLLLQSRLTLSLAESCTGGLIAKTFTDYSGSSGYLLGGIVCYTAVSKHRDLAVPQSIIDHQGVVSKPCAQAMALGAQKRFASDLALSVTGVAGPGGGSAKTPVGTVYLGFAHRSGVRVERHLFEGNRSQVRNQALRRALEWLCQHLADLQAKPGKKA